MGKEGVSKEEQQMLDDVKELADRLELSIGATLSLLTHEQTEKIRGQLNVIEGDIYDIHEEVVPDEEEHIISPSKAEIIYAILVFGFVFLLGIVIGGLVF